MEIIYNKSTTDGGVYALFFDNDHIYIGSSKNLHSRFLHWKHSLTKRKGIRGKINGIIEDVSCVWFEILHICNDPVKRSILEEDYIFSYKKTSLAVLNINIKARRLVGKEVFAERLSPIPNDGIINRPFKPRKVIPLLPMKGTIYFLNH